MVKWANEQTIHSGCKADDVFLGSSIYLYMHDVGAWRMLARCLTKDAKSCEVCLLEFALLAAFSEYGNGKEALNILDL